MAESQKNASSSMNLKEKNLLLDLDIGKDFVSSWKSMSMAVEDALDFDFVPVPKDKKNIFSFDKVDMDFNLDSDFGKISSFNMDISDLDISSPPGKDPKFKEKLKVASSGGDDKGKSDRFTFAFDFNELESFKFESNLEKGPKALANKDHFESSPNESGCQDKGDTSNMKMIEDALTLDEEPKKPLVRGTVTSFDMDCQVDKADSELTRKNCLSVVETDSSGTSNLSITIEEGASDKVNTSSEPAIATRSQPKIIQPEKLIFPDQIVLEAPVRKNAIPDFSSNTLSDIEPSLRNSADFLDRVGLTGSVGEPDANMPSTSASSFSECMTLENLHRPQSAEISKDNNGKKIQDGIEIHVKGDMDMTEIGQVVPLVEKPCMTSVIPGQFSDIPTSSEDRKSAPVILKLVSVSQAVDNSISEKETKPHEACSMTLLQTVKSESNMQKASSTQTRVSLLSNKKVGFTQSSLFYGKREGSHAGGVYCERKTNNSSTTQNKEAAKLKSSLRQREQSMKGLDTFRSFAALPSLTMEVSRKSSLNSANSTTLSLDIASLPAPAKEDKSLAVEGPHRNSDFRGQKNSSLNLDPSESPILNGVSTLEKIGKSNVISKKMPADSAHFAGTQKLSHGTLSLKRKTMEECSSVFTIVSPPKRPSPSPKERRNVEETSEMVPDKQVSSDDNTETGPGVVSSSANSQISTLDTPREVNFKDLEMCFSMKSNANITQAEVYSKELDNICNMMRKKHEEAKEILVRSIVNSNKLLLLNHPLRNEKIYFKCSPV